MNLAERTFKRSDYIVTSPYGSRIHPTTKKQSFHYGIDYGTHLEHWDIFALEQGKIIASNQDATNGNYIWVEYPRLKLKIFYCHLAYRNVFKGESVNENTVLAKVGKSGRASGIHLHMGVKLNGRYFNHANYDYQPDRSIDLLYIDISSYQKNVDYEKVKQSGVKGVILRIGYTGSKNKSLNEDELFHTHYKGFKSVGIPIGVYWFSRATIVVEAIHEARKTLELLQGKLLELPVFWDTEDTIYQNKITSERLTNVALTYLNFMRDVGFKVGVYASKSWLESRLDMSRLNHYEVWVAQYNSKLTYKGKCDMWQYSSSGKINGINGNVDMNICYKDYFSDDIKIADDLKLIDQGTFKNGDLVKVVGTYWATGSKIPLWVKLKQYEIIKLNEKSALLKGVNSWANLNDLKKV